MASRGNSILMALGLTLVLSLISVSLIRTTQQAGKMASSANVEDEALSSLHSVANLLKQDLLRNYALFEPAGNWPECKQDPDTVKQFLNILNNPGQGVANTTTCPSRTLTFSYFKDAGNQSSVALAQLKNSPLYLVDPFSKTTVSVVITDVNTNSSRNLLIGKLQVVASAGQAAKAPIPFRVDLRRTVTAATSDPSCSLCYKTPGSVCCTAITRSPGWWPTDLPATNEYRIGHSAIWTGSKMIYWGGFGGSLPEDVVSSDLVTGGSYDPSNNTMKAIASAPVARHGHTAVFTGSAINKILVWGGSSTNTGSIYDVGANTWTNMASASAPTDRSYHTAVWTGEPSYKMLVFGGVDGLTPAGVGGEYSLATDSWGAMAVEANTPTARFSHTAVWTGTEMIVWGGATCAVSGSSTRCGYSATNTGARYDPSATGTKWTAMSTTNAPSSRFGHTAIWAGSPINKMIVWGGYNSSGTGLANGGIYDPFTNTWSTISTAGAPIAKGDHTAIWTGPPLNKMLVWGGASTGTIRISGPITTTRFSRYLAFYPNIVTSKILADLQTVNACTVLAHSVSSLNCTSGVGPGAYVDVEAQISSLYVRNSIQGNTSSPAYVSGSSLGLAYVGGNVGPSGSLQSFISHTNVTVNGSLNSGRVVLTGGGIFYVGGSVTNSYVYVSPNASNTGGIYDPGANSWSTLTTTGAPVGRWGHTAVWDGKEMIVWGGFPKPTNTKTGGIFTP